MGGPIARRLAEGGHDVAVWNRTPQKAQGLGARVAATPDEAVRGAEFVVTMLADGAAVEETMAVAAPRLEPAALWAQTSTVGVTAAERLADFGAGHGVTCVDAPVLGSRQPAEEGKLVVLAAGPEEVRGRCEEVFAAFSRATFWVGAAPPPARR